MHYNTRNRTHSSQHHLYNPDFPEQPQHQHQQQQHKGNHSLDGKNDQWDHRMFNYENGAENNRSTASFGDGNGNVYYQNSNSNNHQHSQNQSQSCRFTRKTKSPVEKKSVWSRVKRSIFPSHTSHSDQAPANTSVTATAAKTNTTTITSSPITSITARSSPTISPTTDKRERKMDKEMLKHQRANQNAEHHSHSTENNYNHQHHQNNQNQQIDMKILENVKRSNQHFQTQLPLQTYELNKFLKPYLMDDIILQDGNKTSCSSSSRSSTLLVPLNSMSRPQWLSSAKEDNLQVTIGRSSLALLTRKSAIISRRHCTINYEHRYLKNRLTIEDLQSSTGTWKNGERVLNGPVEMTNGDIIQIGTARRGHLCCQILILQGERLSSSLFENISNEDGIFDVACGVGNSCTRELLSPSRDTMTSMQSMSGGHLQLQQHNHHNNNQQPSSSLKLYMECYPSSKDNEGLSVISMDGLPLWRASFMGSIPATLSLNRLLDSSCAITLRRSITTGTTSTTMSNASFATRKNSLLSLDILNSKKSSLYGGIDVISKTTLLVKSSTTGRGFYVEGDVVGGGRVSITAADTANMGSQLGAGVVDIIGRQDGKRTIVSMESLSFSTHNGVGCFGHLDESDLDILVTSLVFLLLVQLVKV